MGLSVPAQSETPLIAANPCEHTLIPRVVRCHAEVRTRSGSGRNGLRADGQVRNVTVAPSRRTHHEGLRRSDSVDWLGIAGYQNRGRDSVNHGGADPCYS
jgi:hypothetical protein